MSTKMEAVTTSVPSSDAKSTPHIHWHDVERRFLLNLEETLNADDTRHHDVFKKHTDVLKAELSNRCQEQSSLRGALYKSMAELARVDRALRQAEKDFHEKQASRTAERHSQRKTMTDWFHCIRSQQMSPKHPVAPVEYDRHIYQLPSPLQRIEADAIGGDGLNIVLSGGHTASPVSSAQTSDLTDANVCDASGNIIGPVKRISCVNQRIEIMLDLPIKRSIRIRVGRVFTPFNLEAIYEQTDSNFSKWVACMIQATGDEQPRCCRTCERRQGPFEECIIVGGETFIKCGNCEWNRQGCHGGSTDDDRPNSMDGLLPAPHLPSPEHDDDDSFAFSSSHYPDYSQPEAASSAPVPLNPPSLLSHPRVSSDLLPPHPSRPGDNLSEIKKINLTLRHDGEHFTEPECMQGVPVAKVDSSHPYWDPSWCDLEDVVQPQLAKWKERYESIGSNAASHSRFQIGRQVNRGHAIIKFLREGDFSPFQLLAKKYVLTGKGGLTSYDTLFRLANTIDELRQFNIDITPIEWIRERFHEIIIQEGDSFHLAKAVHKFYRDPKLAALRSKNGFRDIGRPSGGRTRPSVGNRPAAKRHRPLGTSAPSSPKCTPPPGSSLPMVTAFSQPNQSAVASYSFKMSQPSPESMIRSASTLGSTAETTPPGGSGGHPEEAMGDIEKDFVNFDDYGEITDTDSVSGNAVPATALRVLQVKHRLLASNKNVTQYWSLFDNLGDSSLEHQVLRGLKPAEWGTYEQPIDFTLILNEVDKLLWAPTTLKAVALMKEHSVLAGQDGRPRGDLMVLFKRRRTLHRFCNLLQSKGVSVIESERSLVEERWRNITPEEVLDLDLPDNDTPRSHEEPIEYIS